MGLVRRPRLRAKLAFLTVATTACVLAASAWMTSGFFRRQLVEMASEASSTESDSLRTVLEEQMMAGDRMLLRRLVGEIGREPRIAWVAVLDVNGRVQVSSDPAAVGRVFPLSSPDCQVCHAHATSERQRSVTLVHTGALVLRTVTPLVNREGCRRCHGTERRLNGVLIVDRSLDPVHTAAESSLDQVLLGSLAALVVLLATLGFAIERQVLRRLHRLREAARQLGRGDLTARAVDLERDEIGDLAEDFNAMAERLATALVWVAAERRKLDELVQSIADGVVLVDTELRILSTNRAFTARLPSGVRAEVGAGYAEVAQAVGFAAEGSAAPAARALTSGHLEKEIVRVSDPRGDRFEEIYAQPLRGNGGAIVAVVEVWRDISDRKALEAGLEQSERLATLGMLASGIAHEVGNPLASIATAVQGLLRRMQQPGGVPVEEIGEYLSIVNKQVFRCQAVTKRLLGFARLPSHDLTTVDAGAAAREVLALVSPQAGAQNVEVRASLDSPAPALAPERLLEQVFLNLVVNALRAMPDGGLLRVEAYVDDDAVRVVVADTGPGIPEPLLRHLFDPVRRANAPVVGTGLGLFLSQTLLARCGGSLGVETGAGRGTTFTVRLRRPAQPGPGEGGARDARGRGQAGAT